MADYPLLISLSFRDADILRDEVIFANSDEDEYVALSIADQWLEEPKFPPTSFALRPESPLTSFTLFTLFPLS